MKRLSIILMALVMVLSCEKPQAGTDGKEDGEGTVSECVVPKTAQAGKDVIVQWDGFTQGADVFLVASDGKEYDMDVRSVTSSGLTFRIPSNVPAGVYTVKLVQNGSKELGQITVAAAPLPVTGLKMPSGAKQGEVMQITGVGFEDGCSLKFAMADADPVTLEASLTNVGVSVVIPEDMQAGEYEVSLLQDGMSWVIAEHFQVYEELVMKTLVRIEYDLYENMELRYSWDISYSDPISLTFSFYSVSDGTAELETCDKYVCTDGSRTFELTEDGFEESNDLKITYDRNVESGFPDASDVLIWGDEEPTHFTWTYDADGFLTEISSPTRSFCTLEYKDGNLTVFRNTVFKYENEKLVNHPGAADVAWGYIAVMEYKDPFYHIPYLLGWYDLDSSLLPSSVTIPDPEDPTGSSTVDYPLSYEFDEDGYVISMAWDTNKIGYFYE